MNGCRPDPAQGAQRQRSQGRTHAGRNSMIGFLAPTMAPAPPPVHSYAHATQPQDRVPSGYYDMHAQAQPQAPGMALDREMTVPPPQEPGGNVLQLPFSFGTASARPAQAGGYDAYGLTSQPGSATTAESSYAEPSPIYASSSGMHAARDGRNGGPYSSVYLTSPSVLAPGPATASAVTHTAGPSLPAPRHARPIAPRPGPPAPISIPPISIPAAIESDDDGADDDSQQADGDDIDDADLNLDDPEQPWGMPQEKYKALSSAKKKQIRNKIGAKKFRAKRKAQSHALEVERQGLADENAALIAKLKAAGNEITLLKQALIDAGLPVPVLNPVANGGAAASFVGSGGYLMPNAGGSTGAPYGADLGAGVGGGGGY